MVNMKQLHTFSYGLLPFVLFTVILYAFFYNHHLLFAEQLRLFEWNKDYFNEIVYNPGGLYRGVFHTVLSFKSFWGMDFRSRSRTNRYIISQPDLPLENWRKCLMGTDSYHFTGFLLFKP